jgi:anhydro-N-acetylmuramic acid kinase
MNHINVVGIMSGTSLDGVDFVFCEIKKEPFKFKFLKQFHSSFSKDLINRLRLAARHESTVNELALLHHDLGRFYARELLRHKKASRIRIDLVGLHGQTVFHQPPQATLQIGEPSYVSALLNVPVISDFRVADLALQGQGAPLATIFHAALFEEDIREESVAVNNLGGISNVSFFQKRSLKNLTQAKGKKILSFDTGPANMLIDLACQQLTKQNFDKNGKIAASGLPNISIVKKWMKHPFFKKAPPKSCGREEFGEIFLRQALRDMGGLSSEDKISTLTEFTAESIANSYQRFLPDLPKRIYLCGGGARNSYLKFRIQYRLPTSKVMTTDEIGWPVDAIEGAAFALMAAMKVWNRPAHLPKTTGARRAANLGKIISV